MPPNFKEVQQQFAAQIRDPSKAQPLNEAIEARRLKIYQDLFFKNIESFAANAFPVFRSLFDESLWVQLVREFLIVHRATTPYFLEISQEFMVFVQQYRGDIELPVFSTELMHYEWVELALDVADEEIDWHEIDPNGDLIDSAPVLSPFAWPLSYQYPVHQISRDYRPDSVAEAPIYLLVFRDRQDKVRFSEINAAIYRLLMRLKDDPDSSLQDHIKALGSVLGLVDTASLLAFSVELLDNFRSDGIILGCKRR